MSTTSSNLDLPSKYQRLAAEYTKLRVQLPVLKKAVTDGKSRNIELEERLHDQRKVGRRLEAEVESLQFRNEQLKKRVEHLQQSLEEANHAGGDNNKKAKGDRANGEVPRSQSSFVVSTSQSAIEEDLLSKIKENAKLHSIVFELEQCQDEQMRGFEQKFAHLESENARFRSEMERMRDGHQAVIDRLEADNGQLRRDIAISQTPPRPMSSSKAAFPGNDVKSFTASLDSGSYSDGLGHLEAADNDDLAGAKSGVDYRSAQTAKQTLKEFSRVTRQILKSLANFFMFSEQRARLYPCDESLEALSDNTNLLCTVLSEHSELILPLMESLCSCFELYSTSDPFEQQRVINEFSKLRSLARSVLVFYEDFLQKYEISIAEESQISWCDQRLAAQNQQWNDSVRSLFGSGVTELLRWADTETQDVAQIIAEFAAAVGRCATIAVAASEAFASKMALEQRLPTVSRRVQSANECVAAALSALGRQLRDLAASIQRDQTPLGHYMSVLMGHSGGGSHSGAAGDVCSPAESATDDRSTGGALQELTLDLRRQLEERTSAAVALTREKEQLTVQLELLKMKQNYNRQQDIENEDESKTSEVVKEWIGTDEVATVEAYYSARVMELSDKLLQTSGLLTHYEHETLQLLQANSHVRSECDSLRCELESMSKELDRLNDELQTTRDGYEGQMASMSEHLAEMNAKLASQAEQIIQQNASAARVADGTRSGRRPLLFK